MDKLPETKVTTVSGEEVEELEVESSKLTECTDKIASLEVDNTMPPPPPPPSTSDYIDLFNDGSVLKKCVIEGTGNELPYDGCRILCNYTCNEPYGKRNDTTAGREPFEFELGSGAVIKGFDLGASSMKKGEKALFIFAPNYAYGKNTIYFEIEMLDWKPVDLSPNKDQGIERYILKRSEKRKTPNEGALVKVHLVGRFEGSVFDDREVEFNLGEHGHNEIIAGVQIALLQMAKSEIFRLVIKPKYAYGSIGCKDLNIPPNATVEYTVTLISFEKCIKTWKLNEEESIEQAKFYKEKGTDFYKKQDYPMAIKMYEKSNSYLSNCSNPESQEIKAAVHLNIALCHQKLDDDFKVKEACNVVLEIQPNNIKALYRRGQSALKCGQTESAMADFMRIKELEPNNGAVTSQITSCNRIIREAREKDKKLYANMFAKFAIVDNEKEHVKNEEVLACGEWNMEEEARKEADLAFQEVDQNVVMI